MTQPFDPPTPSVYEPNGPSFDEYRWSQLTEEVRRCAANIDSLLEWRGNAIRELEAILAHLETLPTSSAVDTLTARLENVRDVVGGVNGRLADLEHLDLDERLRVLEEANKPPVKDRDDLNERIVTFLESVPNLKFSAISIRENLGDGTKDVYDRCKTLARNGRIRMFAEPNRRALYQALPVADEVQS